jgi:GT2 family glycosyltransferase
MVYVIIPVHNRINFTLDCLEALKIQTTSNFQIVVVDDGSTDGTFDIIRSKYKGINILRGSGNYWWTKAVNEGVKFALKRGAKYIMTLNNDTIPSKNLIEMMFRWSKAKPEAILGSLEIDSDGSYLYGGHLERWATETEIFLIDVLSKTERSGLHKSDTLPGRGLWIPVSVFSKVGFFDQKIFPQTLADYDLVSRANKNDYEVFCNYDAKLVSFPKESWSYVLKSKKSIANFLNHLFSRKGGGNLWYFTVYSVRHCPLIYLLPRLLFGYYYRTVGYWAK